MRQGPALASALWVLACMAVAAGDGWADKRGDRAEQRAVVVRELDGIAFQLLVRLVPIDERWNLKLELISTARDGRWHRISRSSLYYSEVWYRAGKVTGFGLTTCGAGGLGVIQAGDSTRHDIDWALDNDRRLLPAGGDTLDIRLELCRIRDRDTIRGPDIARVYVHSRGQGSPRLTVHAAPGAHIVDKARDASCRGYFIDLVEAQNDERRSQCGIPPRAEGAEASALVGETLARPLTVASGGEVTLLVRLTNKTRDALPLVISNQPFEVLLLDAQGTLLSPDGQSPKQATATSAQMTRSMVQVVLPPDGRGEAILRWRPGALRPGRYQLLPSLPILGTAKAVPAVTIEVK